MQIRSIQLLSLSFLLFATGCSSIYMPNVPATPMFKQQGEAYVAAHANIKGNISANAGVAFAKNIALIANGSYIDWGSFKSNELFKQRLIEGGLGYFTTIGKQKLQVLEVYGGYGIGQSIEVQRRAGVNGMEPVARLEMDFDKIFVQVNYSSTRKRKLDLLGKKREMSYGTAIRGSRVSMQDFTIEDLPSQKEEAFFIEPLFYTRLALNKNLHIQYTNGFNFNILDNTYLKAGNAVFTLGLTYKFGGKENK